MWQAGGKALKLAHCAMDKRLRIFQAFGHKRLPAGSALECGTALQSRLFVDVALTSALAESEKELFKIERTTRECL
jgi:hypothetical protein